MCCQRDRYDFSRASQRIEVKAAAGAIREHHSSLEQPMQPVGTRVVIASFLLERAAGGTSLEDLLSRIRPCLTHSAELLMRFDLVCADTLGSGWRDAYEQRFDLERARQSLAFFDADVVPKPRRRARRSSLSCDLSRISRQRTRSIATSWRLEVACFQWPPPVK